VVVFGQSGLEIGGGDMVWASLVSTPSASIIFGYHKRLSGGCDFNSLNNSSRGTVAKLVHWSLIA